MEQPSSPFVLTRNSSDGYGPMDLPHLIDGKVSLGLAQVSGINVGAVGLGSSGVAFLGHNVEFPDRPSELSINAAQFLVMNLMIHSEQHLRYLAVSDDGTVFKTPCLLGDQFLREIREEPDVQILIKDPEKDEKERYESLEKLIPHTFSPASHLPEDYPALLQPRHNHLTLLDPDSALGICAEALAAANISYAPYSNCPSGVALKDRDGNVYKGWFIESLIRTSSLGPIQAALVDFVIRTGGNEFNKIIEAVLVEKKDAEECQEDTARLVFEKIAQRDCVFKVFHCH